MSVHPGNQGNGFSGKSFFGLPRPPTHGFVSFRWLKKQSFVNSFVIMHSGGLTHTDMFVLFDFGRD